MMVLVSFQVSQAYNRMDFTLVLKILILLLHLVGVYIIYINVMHGQTNIKFVLGVQNVCLEQVMTERQS